MDGAQEGLRFTHVEETEDKTVVALLHLAPARFRLAVAMKIFFKLHWCTWPPSQLVPVALEVTIPEIGVGEVGEVEL